MTLEEESKGSINSGSDKVVKCFFKVFYPDIQIPPDSIRKIITEAKRFHRKGWRYQDICNAIVEYDKNSDEKEKISSLTQIGELISETPPLNIDDNLLEDKYYYHHRLQNKPDPAEIYIDDDGNVIREKQHFYLEMISSFTLHDLNEYFSKRLSIKDKNIIKRNYRKLKSLINDYELDVFLFSIDYAYNFLTEKNYRKIKNVYKITDYISGGLELYNRAQDSQKGEKVLYYNAYLKEKKKRKGEDQIGKL